MTVNNIGNKFILQKKHVAFFTIVPLLVATAFVKVPCPTCHGNGVVSSTGMEEVYVTRLVSTEVGIFLVGCDTYRVYQYDITLTLDNYADHDAGGYINLVLIDYFTSQLLDTKFTVAEIPAGTSVEHTCAIYFMTSSTIDHPNRTEIQTEVLRSNTACRTCAGTGKVALNTLALSQSLRDTLVASQRIETPAVPPLFIDEHT
ncbi:MAG: hypothetical protein FWH51_05250 [Dehalococcoidia bacterium]|nr:hypothetical protein [Dehalococcoidia bacterium]